MSADCCVSTLTSAVPCVLERLWNPLEQQIFYLFQYKSNLETFSQKARELEASKTDVLRRATDAENKGEEIKAIVWNWHVQAIQKEMDVQWLEEKIEKTKGCCHTCRLDWRSRHRLSRLAKKMTSDIDAHLLQASFPDGISFPARLTDLRFYPTSDFVPLETSSRALNSIMELLKDDNNKIIGVHGTGGVGKTALMQRLVKQVVEKIPFDKVLLVPVTQTPNLRIIQNTIANLLEFEIEGDIEYSRAATLSHRLKRIQRVLIILDDLWERLELAKVGIPYGEEHKGCKIVVTSRFEHVCNKMESNKNIQIQELSKQDGIRLFKIKAQLPDSNAFDVPAEEVVNQCGRLPNSIIIIGRALRKKLVSEWNDAIKKERESTAINIEGISEGSVLSVKVGYNQLETVAKDCLQYNCLFPPYYSVSMEEFVIYGLVDRLFPDVVSLGEVWDKMLPVVANLKSSNLLLEGDREGSYRAHDDTRKVVKFIASKEGKSLMAEAGLKKGWPKEDLKNCKKMSLMDSNVTELPDQPECPQLLTLFLQNNPLEVIPTSFFEQMRELTFLDLSYTNISSLPLSLQCLEKLCLLRLENTHIRDASLIREFDELEVLILKGSSIDQLPNGLEEMTKLMHLDLSNNLFLKGIPSNVISKLSRLEELYIGNSFGDWEVEATTKQQNAGFSEVASLVSLTALCIHVKNTKILSKEFDGPWRKLKRFRVCVNDDYWDITSTRSMHLKNLSNPLANWVKLLLEKTEWLTLTRSSDLEEIAKIEVQHLNQLISIHLRACSFHRIFRSTLYSKVQNLEVLHVEYCYSLKEVFYLEEIEEEQAGLGLTRLRELILVGLPKLTAIWKGNHSIVGLENLKLMKVKECGKLRNLFSKTLAQRLHTLEHLTILKCDGMEAIVSNDEAEVGKEMVLDIPSPPMLFQNLQKLTISKCNKMQSALPLTIVQGLNQLEELTVVSCNQMERIITVSSEEIKAEYLPKLKILSLEDLPKLDAIYNSETIIKWLFLEELQVWDCPNLKKLPLNSRSAPRLKKFRAQSAWFEGLQCEGYAKERLRQRLLTRVHIES